MRVLGESAIECKTGWLAVANKSIFDPLSLYKLSYKLEIGKEYSVYSDGARIVVNSDSTAFCAENHPEFKQIGTVNAPDGEMVLFESDESILFECAEEIANNDLLVVPMKSGNYVTWVEQMEDSTPEICGLFCISDKIRLVLSKPETTRIHELEQTVSKALRLKGLERLDLINSIKNEILDMHFNGFEDGRLKMLASSVKLQLPQKAKTKREEFHFHVGEKIRKNLASRRISFAQSHKKNSDIKTDSENNSDSKKNWWKFWRKIT